MKCRLLILMSLILLRCTNDPTGPSGPTGREEVGTPPIKVEALAVLRVGSTTPLSVDLSPTGRPEISKPAAGANGSTRTDPEGGSRGAPTMTYVEPTQPTAPPPAGSCERLVSYAWRTSGGRISGQGPVVTFTAPDHPDTVNIVVVVTEADGTTMTGATTIIVFKQWVVLKADDFRYAPATTVSPGWRRFIDFIEARKIPASMGLIGIELERGDGAFAALIHDLASDPRYEFWNHGYDHALNHLDATGRTVSEFKGTSYDYQLDHLLRAQKLASEKCGIVMHAFGAPGNAFDSNTARAIDACDDIHVWFLGASYSEKLVLPHSINIEQPIFHPNEAAFIADYDPAPPCVTYQIHPKDWDMERFGAFTRIIDFLIAQDVSFTTPSAFEQIFHNMAGGR